MSLIEKFERARYIVNTIGLSEVLDLVTVPSSKNKYDEYTDDLITELCDHYQDVEVITKFSGDYDIVLYYNGYLYQLWIANRWYAFLCKYTIVKCDKQHIENNLHFYQVEHSKDTEAAVVENVRPSMYNKARFYNYFVKNWLATKDNPDLLKFQRVKLGALNSFNKEQ